MERQLIIMRHAKSSWASNEISDHERPLNERGQYATPRVGQELTKIGWQPQYVLSSDAQRTRETAALLLSEWEQGIEAAYLSSLYLAGPNELRSALAGISDEVESLLALGHNPGWEGVVNRLSGVDLAMKTATAALLKGECDSWADAFSTDWSLENIIHPRELD